MSVLAMVALWVPLAGHCRLVQWSVLDFLACSEHEQQTPVHGEKGCGGDACRIIESGLYRPQWQPRWIWPPTQPQLTWGGAPAFKCYEQPARHLLATAQAPPELIVTWQFLWRAAQPPRAPTLSA